MKEKIKNLFSDVKPYKIIITLIGSFILAFGLYNIHSVADITEGGILGLTLLLEHWFKISPAVSGFILNIICYIMGWKLFGKNFIIYSFVATFGFSLSYKILELFPPVYPEIVNMPLVASVIGALFIGISCGLCVRMGGAPSGDDALAMSVSKVMKVNIKWVYLFSDLIVLLLSLSYIPFSKIMYSLLTVILSGQVIGIVIKFKIKK